MLGADRVVRAEEWWRPRRVKKRDVRMIRLANCYWFSPTSTFSHGNVKIRKGLSFGPILGFFKIKGKSKLLLIGEREREV